MNKREAQEQLEEMFTKEELKYYLENFGPGIKPTQKMINYRFNKESVKE